MSTTQSSKQIAVFVDGERVAPFHLKEVLSHLNVRGNVEETRLYCTEGRSTNPKWREHKKALRNVNVISPSSSGMHKGAVNLRLSMDLMAMSFKGNKDIALVTSDPELLQVMDTVKKRDPSMKSRLLILAPNYASWMRSQAESMCDEYIEYQPTKPERCHAPDVNRGSNIDKPPEWEENMLLKLLEPLGYMDRRLDVDVPEQRLRIGTKSIEQFLHQHNVNPGRTGEFSQMSRRELVEMALQLVDDVGKENLQRRDLSLAVVGSKLRVPKQSSNSRTVWTRSSEVLPSGPLLGMQVLMSLGYIGEDLDLGVEHFENRNADRLPPWYTALSSETTLSKLPVLSALFTERGIDEWEGPPDTNDLRQIMVRYGLLDNRECSDLELQLTLIKILTVWKRTQPSASFKENIRIFLHQLNEVKRSKGIVEESLLS